MAAGIVRSKGGAVFAEKFCSFVDLVLQVCFTFYIFV